MALGAQVSLDIACEMAGDYMMNTLGATSPDDNDGSVLKKTKSKEKRPRPLTVQWVQPSPADDLPHCGAYSKSGGIAARRPAHPVQTPKVET